MIGRFARPFIALIWLIGVGPAMAWHSVAHNDGTAYQLTGQMVSGAAETSGDITLLVEPLVALPELTPGEKLSYRTIIFNYGDNYVCGLEREIKITIDGQLVREPGAPDEWHVFRKGFLTGFFGEILSYESFAEDGRDDDLASRLLAAKSRITLERKNDNCGDDGVFVFDIGG